MSTNFLNRRMDLKHTYEKHFISASTFEFANILTMDTSYPVKLAGKILKLFTASVSYPYSNHSGTMTGDDWILQNSEGEQILRIPTANVYDFAGRIIDNNIGEDKAYSANASVFQQMDYVMVIIDFDDENGNANPSIHLCSQTNFENFITDSGKGKGNLKLFNVTGETVIDGQFDNIGVDEDILDLAIEFENESEEDINKKTYSLVRNDLDNVMWEKPINNEGAKSATPVANVNNININGVNASIQNFIFPEINVNNCYRGWDATQTLKMYSSIEGAVNDDFIDTYCFTNEELQNLAIFPMEYLHRFYENITGDKNDYVYAIGHGGRFSGDHKAHNTNLFYAYPIKKSDNRFKILNSVFNSALTCNGSGISIASLNTKLIDMCGTYWAGEHINGYDITHFQWRTKTSGTKVSNTRISFVHEGITGADSCSYSKYIDNNKSANTKLSCLTVNEIFTNNSTLLTDITRFIDFFGNNDTNYKNIIRKMSVSFSNNTFGGTNSTSSNSSAMFKYDDSSVNIIGTNTLPINVVALYPEFFENILYGTEKSSNPSIRNCLISDGKDYKFGRKETWWWGHELSSTIIYNLFDRYDTSNDIIKPVFINDSNMNVTIAGENGKYIMRPISHFNDNSAILIDKDGKHNIVFMVNYLMLNTVNTPYYETEKPDYNNAEMSTQSMAVLYKDIKIANEYISEADGTGNLVIEIDGVSYDLYTVRRENNTLSYIRATTSNLKDTTSNSKGITYLYYFDDANLMVHRLKYFFKVNDGTGIRPYDFFKDSVLFKQTQVSISSRDYRWTFNNSYISAYEAIEGVTTQAAIDAYNTAVMNAYQDIILYVIDKYKYFPYNLSEGDNLPEYGGNNAVGLAEIDYSVNHACSESVYTTLRELVDPDYAVVINCKAPHASAIKVNDSYVYNVASYNKWLKNTKVSDVFVTNMFPYINGCGIRKEYYNNISLYDFFLYAVNRDLGKKFNSENSFYTLDSSNVSFFTKEEINNIKVLTDDGEYHFKDDSNNPVTVSTNLNFINNINKKNIFGFNPITITDNNDVNVDDTWNSSDKIYLIKNDTGSKTVYSIALNDGNPNNPTIMSTNGNIDTIDVSNIKWNDLLLALNNNKSIDILSTSLKYIKSQLNTYFITDTQNVNSDVSMQDNVSQADADAHNTNREGRDEFSPSSSHYKTHDAEFDSEHNVYKFNYGYGFDSSTKVREINNRGVIVFESKDFKTNQIRSYNSGETPDDYKYQTEEGTIYARRMYINNDGLLCTKDYFDREEAEYTPSGGTAPVYPDNPTTIATLLKKIEDLEARIATLEGN